MDSRFRSAAGGALVHGRYRAMLDAWPVPHTERRIPTSQGDTFVLECGPADAPPVVLLHGGGSTSVQWARNAALWSSTHRLIAIDLIGEPGFSAPSRSSFSSDAHARWLDDVCAALRLSEVCVVAASLGALVAIDYAVRRPGRVRRLALLSPAGIASMRARYLLTAVPLFFLGARGRRKTLDLVLGLPPEEHTPQGEAFLEFGELVLAHHRMRTQPLPKFRDEELRQLTMPVLAIVGRNDIVFSAAAVQRRLKAHLPYLKLIELANAGHGLADPSLAVHDFLQH